MSLGALHFLRPWWFLVLIPLVFLLWQQWRQRTVGHDWAGQCDPHLLPHLLCGHSSSRRYMMPVFLCLAWLLAVLALAGPTWSHWPQPVYRQQMARVIALDVSESMNANDLLPSRLQRARYKVLDLLKRIKSGQTGMLVFSSEPFVVSPLTEDSNTIANMVPVLNSHVVPVQGSNIALALKKSVKLMQQADAVRGSIILITDSQPNTAAFSEAKQLAKQGYHLLVLGVGTEQGGPIPKAGGGFMLNQQGEVVFAKLDPEALEKLASEGAGRYVAFTNDNRDLTSLLSMSQRNQHHVLKAKNLTKVLWADQGHWLIWGLLILLLIVCRRGWLERLL